MKIRVRAKDRKRRLAAGRHREPLAIAIGPEPTHLAFVWYSPESWEQLRATADDPEALDESYEAWLASASDAFEDVVARGMSPIKFHLDVSAAAAWAKQQGCAFDSSARASFVAVQRPTDDDH